MAKNSRSKSKSNSRSKSRSRKAKSKTKARRSKSSKTRGGARKKKTDPVMNATDLVEAIQGFYNGPRAKILKRLDSSQIEVKENQVKGCFLKLPELVTWYDILMAPDICKKFIDPAHEARKQKSP